LGSTQDAGIVDAQRCRTGGVGIVRRRSGGGAVLMGADDPLWVDVWVPRDDPLWSDDAIAAVGWVGAWWRDALARPGGARAGSRGEPLSVHAGPAVAGPGSELCCFAGLGPGEVRRGRRKVVGVAQWRCRTGALFHCAAYERWQPAALVSLLDLGDARRTELQTRWASAASGVGVERGALVRALATHLPGAGWSLARERGLPLA
jgi:lipoate---protein ligase